MELAIEYIRFKQIREELKFTQAEFGRQLGLSSSTADIERGKIRILGKTVEELLKQYKVNPLWLYGESDRKYLEPDGVNVMPKVISVNAQEEENILMVPAKAAAGYGHNIADENYMQELPSFSFPLAEYRNASFRGFQIMGDSMIPLVYSGDWVLAKAVEDLKEVINNQVYVVVESDSIRLKKIEKNIEENSLRLISLNPEYAPTTTSTENILEMWQYHSKISFGIDRIKGLSLQSLQEDIQEIKERLG